MVKMDEYAKMVAYEDEVDALESKDVEELAAHRMDKMGARHKITRDPSRQDMLRVRRLVLLLISVLIVVRVIVDPNNGN